MADVVTSECKDPEEALASIEKMQLSAVGGEATHPYLGSLAGTSVESIAPIDKTDVIKKGCFAGLNVCVLMINEKCPRAFKKLVDAQFLSAPVLDRETCVGIVELAHFVRFLVSLVDVEDPDDLMVWDEIEWQRIFDKDEWQKATVTEVLRLGGGTRPGTPFMAVRKGFSVLSALEMMTKSRLQRLPVLDEEGHVESILTASMVISLFRQQILEDPAFTDLLNTPIALLMVRGASSSWGCISRQKPALSAFKIMAEEGLSALGVEDEQGTLIDAISVRDLKLIGYGAERFKVLSKSVGAFKDEVRRLKSSQAQHAQKEEEADKPNVSGPQSLRRKPNPEAALKGFGEATTNPALYVTQYDPLKRVLELMADGRIHRIFVAAEDTSRSVVSKPRLIGAVDQLNVIEAVLEHIGVCFGHVHQ